MSDKNKPNNPSAFPVIKTETYWVSDNPLPNTFSEEGMTIRDYFAAKVMQSIYRDNTSFNEGIAEEAYKMADAMLAERSKQ